METSISIYLRRDATGFTLIELVAVILVIAVLSAIAVQRLAPIGESARIAETERELDRLAAAIVGDPNLQTAGTRTSFGYVGDVGSLPPDLNALVSNPGFATWRGPYVRSDFTEYPDDYKEDAWGTEYDYRGLAISSFGSGEIIEKRLAGSLDHLLRNSLAGNLFDRNGTPPGFNFRDSLIVYLTVPDGSGRMKRKSSGVDQGGYFAFDSVPIGTHRLTIIYGPGGDTLRRFVSVPPDSRVYGEYYLTRDVWQTGKSGLSFPKDRR